MESSILVPFVLLFIPFPAFAIRVLSTGTDYDDWAEGGSIHSEGGVAGASYVSSAHLPHLFSSITVCFRFFEFAVTNGFLVSSDLSPEQAMDDNDYILKVDNRPRVDGESKYLGILYQGQFYQTRWRPRRWHHVCISYQATSGKILIISDGHKVYDFIDNDLVDGAKEFPKETLKNLRIMSRSRDGHTGIFGKMTDVNIWDTALEESTQISWTECKDSSQGNILSWENSSWVLTNLFEENQDRAGLCIETTLGLTIVPITRDFETTRAICKRLGGSMAVANSPNNLQAMARIVSENAALCPNDRVYAGFTDLKEEGR